VKSLVRNIIYIIYLYFKILKAVKHLLMIYEQFAGDEADY